MAEPDQRPPIDHKRASRDLDLEAARTEPSSDLSAAQPVETLLRVAWCAEEHKHCHRAVTAGPCTIDFVAAVIQVPVRDRLGGLR